MIYLWCVLRHFCGGLQLCVWVVWLKEPQVIETIAFPRIGFALITPKLQVQIYFVQ